MDYYRMENIQADTTMRESISGTPQAGTKGQSGSSGTSKGKK
jgi:uncharacterized protein YqfA (UPF0365 family)